MSQNYSVKPRKSDLTKSHEELLTALIAGNQLLATRLVDDAIALRWEPSFVYVHLIGYCLAEIGSRWHAGELDIATEHRATQIALRLLSKAQDSYLNGRRIGRSAIITSVEGDNHVIGGLTFADLLRFEGWDVDFLGADSPVDSIVELVGKESPELVGLSVTTEQFVSNAVATVDALKNLPTPPVVVVGGAAATVDSIPRADFCSTDAIEVVGWTQTHFNLDESSMSIEVMLVELGVRIQSLRKDRGLSQQRLAADAGLDRSYISAIEHGKQNVSFATLKGISDALGVGVSELISG
ncbi:MAG: cobalamin-dependent protein [Dehalococcoidia bacterium]|nr:cobalamin-dependent protein [Dehalococcoidia bacterium]